MTCISQIIVAAARPFDDLLNAWPIWLILLVLAILYHLFKAPSRGKTGLRLTKGTLVFGWLFVALLCGSVSHYGVRDINDPVYWAFGLGAFFCLAMAWVLALRYLRAWRSGLFAGVSTD